MYLDVQVQICCPKIFSFIFTQFLVLLWPNGGPSWSRNWSNLNKRIRKSLFLVNAGYLDISN
jgi:hypothetical protein